MLRQFGAREGLKSLGRLLAEIPGG
jgi:hypothetical protein